MSRETWTRRGAMLRFLRTGALLSTALAAGAQGDEASDRRVAAFAALPDWTGIWRVDSPPVGLDGYPFIEASVEASVSPGNQPKPPPLFIFNQEAPLTPQGRATVQSILQATGGDPGRTEHGVEGWGYPLMMHCYAPLQFFITPEETLIFNGYRDMRRIYTDGRGRPPEEDRWPPTTWGDSVGHWEGDTLVIETIDVRPPREFFGLAMPFTAKARYTERLRKVAPDRIEGEMVIEDPGFLAEPMRVKLSYVRETVMDRIVLDSFRDNRTGWDGENNLVLPP
jgi:hypothetical protein